MPEAVLAAIKPCRPWEGGSHEPPAECVPSSPTMMPHALPKFDPARKLLWRELCSDGKLGLETLIEKLVLQGFHLGGRRLDGGRIRGLLPQEVSEIPAGRHERLDICPHSRPLILKKRPDV